MKTRQSNRLYHQALRLMPGGVQTASKRPLALFGRPTGVPLYMARARGPYVWDVDGNRYVDYVSALGPSVLGYQHPAVMKAAARQLREGVLTSFSHPLEVTLAAHFRRMVPCAEMVRFMKTGAEAASAAVRLARAVTGREVVLTCGYFGWHDWAHPGFGNLDGIPAAVQRLSHPFPFNDLDACAHLFKRFKGRVACVMVEPIVMDEPAPGFLQGLKRLCARHGALLVFDEVKTGFRVHPGGAQALYRVTPDLAVFAKGMAGGFPLSALAGRRRHMRRLERLWVSSTYASEAVSLAAAVASLEVIRTRPVPAHLNRIGRRFQAGLRSLMRRYDLPARCGGHPSMTYFQFTGAPASARRWDREFFVRLAKRGVLMKRGAYNFVSLAHTPAHIDTTLRAVEAVLRDLKRLRWV